MPSLKCIASAIALLLLCLQCSEGKTTTASNDNTFLVSATRRNYDSSSLQPKLHCDNADSFYFARFQSRESIQSALVCSNQKFQKHRHGLASCTKLKGDWVLAESKQVAVDCTPEDCLRAYLSGNLQQEWNSDKVASCSIQRRRGNDKNDYQQDLVLHSQRVLTRRTGLMKYSQVVQVDRINGNEYCVSVRLLDQHQQQTATMRPFDALDVYVHLKPQGNDVSIYAAGVMRVNRNVVPDLIVFDAAGIAGSMAGKGTLWLAGYFKKRKATKMAVHASG
jgi:hypothetical protein